MNLFIYFIYFIMKIVGGTEYELEYELSGKID